MNTQSQEQLPQGSEVPKLPVDDLRPHQIEWNDESVQRLWNYHTENTRVPYFSDLHGREVLRYSQLPLRQPLEVLDFGCGPGFIWDHLQALGSNWQYTGIDFSDDSVAKLKAKAGGAANFRGAQSITGIPTPLPTAAFDVVLLIEVVEHLNDAHLHNTLTEISRLLKPGGALVVSTPNEENISAAEKFCPNCATIFHEWQHVRSWSTASLTARLAEYGLCPERVQALNFSAIGITRRAYFIAKRLVRGPLHQPHMLGLFRKR